ncbi:hypothetical protein PAECIP111893_00982 [Paenibacillus plantiphilus]|uniref:Uncharacterized protein n=2 Tax=Paenibacillus plantiphilus TaxID=2905650 RepID=A0ABN8G8S8_9BACL|nr:hypothetical protein PAECIP111893_00982 [Paenibacillus plantiphilus]
MIVLLGAVAVVYAVITPRKAAQKDEQSSTVRNMETALEQFMENMEADNREMVELVTSAQKEAKQQAQEREERINQLEQRCNELQQSLSEQAKAQQPVAAFQAAQQSVAADREEIETESQISMHEPEAVDPPRSATIRSRYTELFTLHDSGKSVEAIAKRMNMNKGEVQLILQLSKQEEENRHE